MSIVIFVPEHPREIARYRWAALAANGGSGPLQAGLAGVPPGADAILIAPANAVRLTSARLPAKNRRRLTQLAYVVEDSLAADAANLHVVAGPELPGPTGGGQHAIALCERQWMTDALATVRNAGLIPRSMRIETCLPALAAGGWVVVCNGTGGFARTGAASGFGFDAETLTVPPLALRLAIGETKFPPRQIVVRAAAESALPDLPAWSSALRVPVLAGAPWPGLEAGWEASIELLGGDFTQAGRLSRGLGNAVDMMAALRPAAILLALIPLTQLAFTGVEWWNLGSEKQRLLAKMEQDFRATFPDAQQVIDPVLQMRRNLATLRGNSGVADQADFLALAARAAPVLQGSKIKLIKYQQGRLEIDTTFANAQALDNARRTLGGANVQTAATGSAPGILEAHVVLGGDS